MKSEPKYSIWFSATRKEWVYRYWTLADAIAACKTEPSLQGQELNVTRWDGRTHNLEATIGPHSKGDSND